MSQNIILSVIFPIRVSTTHEYIIPRLQNLVEILPNNNNIEYIFVDSGSAMTYTKEIKSLCNGKQIKYLYHNTYGEIFSVGKARDYGVQHANGQFVMFQDVDLVAKPSFYDDVLLEIEALEMEKYVQEFFLIPCFYLTKDASVEFMEDGLTEVSFKKLLNTYYAEGVNKDKRILSFAPASSVMVCNKMHYLAIGGHNPQFYGHGCEDFELIHRLAAYSGKYQRPQDYYTDTKNYDSIAYLGFRAYFSVWGYQAFASGLFMVHIWHPWPAKTPYEAQIPKNRELFQQLMKEFDEKKLRNIPLPDLTLPRKTLVIGNKNDSSWFTIRQVTPLFGLTEYRSEHTFQNLEDFERFIKNNHFTQVAFTNPYGNPSRCDLYKWLRNNNFPYVVYERGALPDSWFFDTNGFNADSRTYDTTNWDNPLTEDEIKYTENYITNLIASAQTLEKNGARIGGEQLRSKIDAKHRIAGRKILFVPFQRPSDTVTNYFAGNAGSYEGFCQIVDDVYRKIDKTQWCIVIKMHPLETVPPHIHPEIIQVDPQTHIYDLLAACDKVLLMNSGVGVLAMLFAKPVCYVSEVFYGHNKINCCAHNADEVMNFINSDFKVSYEHAMRFIHYLITQVYSFGLTTMHERKEVDGSMRSITTAVKFYELRIYNSTYLWHYRDDTVVWHSRAYGVFFASFFSQRQVNAKLTKPSVVVNPVVVTNPVAQNIALAHNDISGRKMRKFRTNPYQFFADSKNPFIRSLRVFYKQR